MCPRVRAKHYECQDLLTRQIKQYLLLSQQIKYYTLTFRPKRLCLMDVVRISRLWHLNEAADLKHFSCPT